MSKKTTIIFWTVVAALSVLSVAIVYAVKSRPRTVPLAECSQVYRQYKDVPGINAAYVKNYHVNDTLTICATLLEAIDSAGWDKLYNDFELKANMDSSNSNHINDSGRDVMEIALYGENQDLMVASHRDKYICIFEIEDSIVKEQIFDALFDKIFYSITNNQTFNNENPI